MFYIGVFSSSTRPAWDSSSLDDETKLLIDPNGCSAVGVIAAQAIGGGDPPRETASAAGLSAQLSF
jgi:hypothetical protein